MINFCLEKETEKRGFPLQNPADKRDRSIDLLQTLAIFGVLTIHTCTLGYQHPVGSFSWLSTVFWGSVVRASVPIFLMCSGALLLHPDHALPLKKLYGKNILRLLAAMLVWAMAYQCYHLAMDHAFTAANLWQSLKEVLLFKQEFHFYYLHIMLLVYVFLPVTRSFVQHADRRMLQYFLILWFALGILYPTLRPFWPFSLLGGIPAQWLMNMTYAAIGYGVLGYYLKRYPFCFGAGLGLFAGGFLFVFGATWIMSLRAGTLYAEFLEGMSVGVAAMAAGLFSMAVQGRTPCPRACAQLSRASFCIFLVHMFFLYTFNELGATVLIGPCLLTIPTSVLCNLALSFLVYLILSRIPVIKKYLV